MKKLAPRKLEASFRAGMETSDKRQAASGNFRALVHNPTKTI
jgi:hypothetical protein